MEKNRITSLFVCDDSGRPVGIVHLHDLWGPRAHLRRTADMSSFEFFSPNRGWTAELDRKARELEWLLLDVDGVLTDGLLHLGPDGEVFKSFHVRDGLAIKLAQAAGIRVAILSARESAIVARRARELGIEEVVQGREDKGAAFRELANRRGARSARDRATSATTSPRPADPRRVGLSAAPADAAPQVRSGVDYVTEARGGRGAVRELVEHLLAARDAWGAVLKILAGEPADGALLARPPRPDGID
jgi:3-deoxy-D-manno-octulosonate 8-phosphate phosphatase (KDO 8-P phosphatase)